MSEIRSIVVGVATVEEMDPVLPCAIRLAQSTGAELHVMHVIDLPEPAVLGGGVLLTGSVLDPGYAARAIDAVVSVVERQVRRFAPASMDVFVHAQPGISHARLVTFAGEVDADLLVVGATRRGRIWRDILGTTAERVLRASHIPVLVMHQPFFRPVERVLLTTDLSEFSAGIHEQGIAVVESLFGGNALEFRSLLVVQNPNALASMLPTDSLEALGAAAVERFVHACHTTSRPVLPRVRVGEPSAEINVEADAWGADLIVLGTHGRRGLPRYLFGSVAAAVLRDASRNVLVIPGAARSSSPGEPIAVDDRLGLATARAGG